MPSSSISSTLFSKTIWSPQAKGQGLSESIPRRVDNTSRFPEEEKGVWGSQGGDRGLEFSRRKKGQMFFPSTFLSLSHIKCFFL